MAYKHVFARAQSGLSDFLRFLEKYQNTVIRQDCRFPSGLSGFQKLTHKNRTNLIVCEGIICIPFFSLYHQLSVYLATHNQVCRDLVFQFWDFSVAEFSA